MIKLTKVTTKFSENNELANREWSNVTKADSDIAAIVAKTYTIADRCYDKTDLTLTWDDGKEVSFRLDANRVNTIVSTLIGRYRYYESKRPLADGLMTVKQLSEARKFWMNLVENYEI